MYPYIVQGKQITVVIDNKPHTVGANHITYERVKQAIRDQDWETVRDIIDPREAIVNFGSGNINIQDNVFYWKGNEMHNSIATRIIEMLKEGFSVDPMVKFMHNVMKNPSKRSVDLLYNFLDKCDLPITPDGHFLAYKKVRANYLDCHSGTIDNSVGQVVTMERNLVDDDPNSTCSAGLHFCSIGYLGSFGGERIMILKINPADVVSIPSDHNDAKGRCARYEVVGELDVAPIDAFKSVVDSTYDKEDELDDSDDNGWIVWEGGISSPRDAMYVDVKLRSGRIIRDEYVDDLGWRHFNKVSDIVAYRHNYE